MEKINWLDKVTNDEVLRRVIMANNELYLAKETSMACFEFFLYDGLLYEITEGRMRGKPI